MLRRQLLRASLLMLLVPSLALACASASQAPATSVLIDADRGGVVQSEDGRLRLEIPPGALAESTEITITRRDPERWSDDLLELEPMGDVYDLGPDGLRFAVPARMFLTLDHDDDTSFPLLEGMSRSSDGTLSRLRDGAVHYDVGMQTATFTAPIEHFSDAFVSAKLKPWVLDLDAPLQYHADVDNPYWKTGYYLALEMERPIADHGVGEEWTTKLRLRNTSSDTYAKLEGFGTDPTAHDPVQMARFDEPDFLDRAVTLVHGAALDLGTVKWRCSAPGYGSSWVNFRAKPEWLRADYQIDITFDHVCGDPPPPEPNGGSSTGGDPSRDSATSGDTEGGTTEAGTSGATDDTSGGSTSGGSTSGGSTSGASTGGTAPWQECLELPPEACEPCCIRMAETPVELDECIGACGP